MEFATRAGSVTSRYYGEQRRHLPPYMSNPFSELPLDRSKIEDAKPIFVLNEATHQVVC